MAITLTISDMVDTATFTVFESPITLEPVISMTDITTIDNNISTYITGTPKRFYSFNLGYMDRETYKVLKEFYDRQFTVLKYPSITVDGTENLNIVDMVGKMTLNTQEVIDNCGTVEGVIVSFRESKQML